MLAKNFNGTIIVSCFISILLTAWSCVSEKQFNESLARIDKDETQIATLEEQLRNVSHSLETLAAADESVKGLIEALQIRAQELEQALSDNSAEISELELRLKDEIEENDLRLLEQLNATKSSLEGQLSEINLALADMQKRQEALEKSISELSNYVDAELQKNKDWVSATFATIEQFNGVVEQIEGIKADILSINSRIGDLSRETLAKIADCEEDMKRWVNAQLANYYTIAEVNAKIALLEKTVAEGDQATADELDRLKKQLEAEKEKLTEAYLAAIEDAIKTNNGLIEDNLLNKMKEVNARITDEVASINSVLSNILLRLSGIDESLSEILAMIQSVVLIPTFSDGTAAIGKESSELLFEIRPFEAAKQLEQADLSAFSFKALSTVQSKADLQFLTLPVTAYRAEDGISVITTNGAGLPETFFSGLAPVNARLSITDGKTDIGSPFIGLRPVDNPEIVKLRQAEYKKNTLERISLSSDNSLIFSFVEGQTVAIPQHSVVPRLYLGQDDYWGVSYDNGENIGRIMGGDGSYIKAGAFDGDSYLKVRLVDGVSNYLKYELYPSDQPETVLWSAGAPCFIDEANMVQSIVFDDIHHLVSLTLQGGDAFQFKMKRVVPQSIGILSNKIRLAGDCTSYFDFRVNPSDATFNFNLASEGCEIALDRTGDATKAGGYITAPTNYQLLRVEQAYDKQGKRKSGQYRAYIKDLNRSVDYDDLISLVLTINDGAGRSVQISSSSVELFYSSSLITDFKFLKTDNPGLIGDIQATIDGNKIIVKSPLAFDLTALIPAFTTGGSKVYVNGELQTSGISSQDFSVPVTYWVEKNEYVVYFYPSRLPVLCIDTPDGLAITSKTVWTENAAITLYDAEGKEVYKDNKLSIRGRGNTSWEFPKKPYALKLNKKAEMLGMPAHKRWVLLANWLDRTLIRTETAFQVSRNSGLAWTPRGQYVELVLNGKHQGNYYLCEQIKVDKNRVNITEMGKKDLEGDALTGGYLVELDTYYDEVNKFKSSVRELPYMFKDPDEDVLQPAQFAFFEQYINSMETELYDDKWLETRNYAAYLDLESFADWWFIYELTMNTEAAHPKSCYMHKDRLGKLVAGPVWDFDYCLNSWSKHSFVAKDAIYYGRLFEDPAFVSLVKERWAALKPAFETIPAHIRTVASSIRISNDINISLWPIIAGWNADESLDFDAACERVITSYSDKLNWLDAQIAAL